MKFKLTEKELVRVWRRYSYEVEAENLEEAMEKVKSGDIIAYDSETLHEFTEDVPPEENDYCATRIIYDSKKNIVWDNALE